MNTLKSYHISQMYKVIYRYYQFLMRSSDIVFNLNLILSV